MTRNDFWEGYTTWDELYHLIAAETDDFECSLGRLMSSDEVLNDLIDAMRYNWNLDEALSEIHSIPEGFYYYICDEVHYFGAEEGTEFFLRFREELYDFLEEDGFFDDDDDWGDDDEDDDGAYRDQPMTPVIGEDAIDPSDMSVDEFLTMVMAVEV